MAKKQVREMYDLYEEEFGQNPELLSICKVILDSDEHGDFDKHMVVRIDENSGEGMIFPSIKSAARSVSVQRTGQSNRYTCDEIAHNIAKVIHGKRLTAYGYLWRSAGTY